MKKLALITIVSAGIIGLSACSSGGSEAVVEMEQGNISQEEFYEELKETAGSTVLQSMVYTSILEDKFDVDEEYVDEHVDMMREQYGEQFESVLQQSGFQSEEDYRTGFRLFLLEQQAVAEGIDVTDEEVETRYERLSTEVEASHILVEDRELAEQLHQELLDGADFAELATEHSIDPGSAQNGGDLGYFGTGVMVSVFEETAFSLAVDEMSEPILSDNGWHIVKVTGIREGENPLGSLEEMSEQIRTEIAINKISDEEAAAKLDALFDDANIKVNIEEFSDLFNQEEVTEDIETE